MVGVDIFMAFVLFLKTNSVLWSGVIIKKHPFVIHES